MRPSRSLARFGWVLAAMLLALPAPATTLREAAAASGRFVGAATSPSELATGIEVLVGSEFNSLTPENQLKWGEVSPAPGVFEFGPADELVGFAEANGMRVRGHTLVWSRLNGPPDWLEGELAAAADPAARLRELMQEQIATVVGRYSGRIAQWDVVNEPLSAANGALDPANPYFQLLGGGFIAEAFHAAHDADPDALLFLNEVGLEASPARFEGLVTLVEELLAAGVPIDGVGLQGHFSAPPNAARLQEQIQALADLGLFVELTEVDIPIVLFGVQGDPLAAQADAYSDVFSACVAVAACRGVTTWGVTDAGSWLDNADFWKFFAPNRPLLFDEVGAPKPARDAVVATFLMPEPQARSLAALILIVLAGLRRSREAARVPV